MKEGPMDFSTDPSFRAHDQEDTSPMLHRPDDVSDAQKESDTIYALRERIRELEAIIGLYWLPPRVLNLTVTERQLLGAIVNHPLPRQQAHLHFVLYGDRSDPPLFETVRMHVCKTRAKLAQHGIEIGTMRGAGYFITPDNLDRLNALYAPGERPTPESP